MSLITFACSHAPAPPTAAGGPITVSGSEHLAWDQAGPSGEVQGYRFVAYVDDVRQPLADASCQNPSAAGAAQCSASLPHMTAGRHRLELTAVVVKDGVETESARSAPLQLMVTASAPLSAAAAASTRVSENGVSRDGVSFTVERLAAGLTLPSAVLILPDQRMLIAEYPGVVRVWRDGTLLDRPATDLRQIDGSTEVGFVGLAVHPQFETNRLVFAVYASRGDHGRVANHVVRLRLLDTELVEPLVLLEDLIDAMPQRAPRAAFGPDSKLYVAFPAGPDRRTAEDPAVYEGKILRLNEDGSTPRDNPGFSPIVSAPHRAPGAFAWDPATGHLWIADRDWTDRDQLYEGARATSPAYQFNSPVGPSAASFYTAVTSGTFDGNLFIAALEGQHIRRVQIDAAGHVVATERLLDGKFGRIADIAAPGDGALYFSTANADPRATPAIDGVYRLRPQPR